MYYALVLFKYSSVKQLPVKFRTLQFSSSKFQSNIPDLLLLLEQGISHCSHTLTLSLTLRTLSMHLSWQAGSVHKARN